MSLNDRLTADMKVAMKNKEKNKLSVIRMVKSSIQNESIKLGHDLTEEEELTVLTREVKQRKDSLLEFEKAGRSDLVQNLDEELSILSVYLPKQLSEEEVEQIVQEVISETGASSKKEMGKVMGALMPRVKGKADGGLVNRLVQKNLS
ncbi:GatB/YqeY domain-containing protein [Bacillus hwajinpoensis]|uniref:GatB/YqeY domain-containing protein n=1 Tax=Guptibacillus hwajinpoensis TaxID=208199 RepID=A0A845EWU8_9BACL|nr:MULTISPECIES: GatB/YqeY domain-containing protein [Bacillaceae]MCA0992888.1 GatB/YqeY domain-containing protein [Pseudalkalibacillus hwajinpoensis]MYL63022.1 GatB/YqeY domain-containing protein [Pseudalkalibacillus hwajinpoensis]QHA92640.1 GatB/YqeY domain-containing protein [Bacillus sp. N1-1]